MAEETQDTNGGDTATKTRGGGNYVVLKHIDDIAELQEILANGSADVYCTYAPTVKARDSSTAVKMATVHDNTVDEGVYVAIPSGSFKPRRVKQVAQVTLD